MSTRPQYTPEESDEEPPPPPKPARPQSQTLSPPPSQYVSPRSPDESPGVMPSPPFIRGTGHHFDDEGEDAKHFQPSGGYHLYNIHEMLSHMGKSKKMPMTLGINVPKGLIMISPEKSKNGPQEEWTADKLTHYSIEGKHVFMDLVRPSKSVDFHAGAKDTAQEIVSALGELAGAARAEGLREVLAVGSGTSNVQKKGKMLYEFMAQGDDEVTVADGDEVVILDDTKSEEWWMVRRLKNGKVGVVPSSYVEVVGSVAIPPPPTARAAADSPEPASPPTAKPTSMSGVNAGRSVVEQNRLEEERLAREASRRHRDSAAGGGGRTAGATEVGPGLQLPARNSSLGGQSADERRSSQRKRDSRGDAGGKGASNAKSSEFCACALPSSLRNVQLG